MFHIVVCHTSHMVLILAHTRKEVDSAPVRCCTCTQSLCARYSSVSLLGVSLLSVSLLGVSLLSVSLLIECIVVGSIVVECVVVECALVHLHASARGTFEEHR